MSRSTRFSAAAALVSIALVTPAAATEPSAAPSDPPAPVYEEEDVNNADALSLGVEGEVNARYVWRGIALSDGPVFQPSVAATGGGFTLLSMANVLLNDEPPAHRVTVVVTELNYTLVLGRLKVEPGVLLFANVDDPYTVEASLDLSYKLGLFRVISSNKVDVRQAVGGYFGTIGLGYERKLHNWTTKAFVVLGYATARFNDLYFGERLTALDVAEAGLSARHDITRALYFTLHAEVSTLLAERLRSSVTSPVLGNGGAALGIEFN